MCSFARYAWKNCSLNILSENDESTPFGQWIQNYILLYHSEDGKNSERIGMFIGVLRSLWLTRNGRVFSNQGGYLADLFRNYNTAMHNFTVWKMREEGEDVRAKDKNNNGAPLGFQRINIGSEKEDITYTTDARLEVTIMVDGSWQKRTRMAGTGWAFSEDQITFMEGEEAMEKHTFMCACFKVGGGKRVPKDSFIH
ncbi:uncharacterized protein LOC110688782 [Chenopodium quinoa]|uniref:uncharacterized protein LOC110688782 n=1 Tax=Chenopodium quinoa TaxID=63459 RepID=UPI000B77C30E|nr:uncharacterized protein LOC110688782 [Chenopodium quinoa]